MQQKYLLGQVGGFPLRLSWLPRAYANYGKRNKSLPIDLEEVSCDLGIGKNMAKSLRIWARAADMIDEKGEFTERAKSLFDRDPYFESIDSIALLHWLICSNQNHCTANTWLLNYYHAGQFTVAQAVKEFRKYLVDDSKAKYAEGTIRVDIETALRMYTSINERKSNDMDDKFLYPLGLFSVRRADGRTIFTRSWETERPFVSKRILAYSVLSTLAMKKTSKSTLSDLYFPSKLHSSPGVVFGFTQSGFYSAMESMVDADSKSFTLTSLPGGDFQLAVKSSLATRCTRGDFSIADKHCFSSK